MNNVLEKLIEHNNWANLKILQACSGLSEDQLDATPQPDQWSIRQNLVHLVESQQGYLSLLTLPPEARDEISLSFAELETSAKASGEGLLALVRFFLSYIFGKVKIFNSELVRFSLQRRGGEFCDSYLNETTASW